MTANGTEISDGESLSGSQVLRVYGSNLTPPYFSLWFNGVEYTPLDYGEGYVEYVLQDNGTYEIKVDNRIFMSFGIEGVTIPSELPTKMVARLYVSSQDYIHPMIEWNANCLNYPYMVNETYTKVRFDIGSQEASFEDALPEDFVGVNCSKVFVTAPNTYTKSWLLTPTDATKPAYFTYKGFIVAVFNYTTTPQP